MTKWITIEDAFKRAVEIEGVPEIAFQQLIRFLREPNVSVQFLRRSTSWPDAKQRAGFMVDSTFWRVVHLHLVYGEFGIEESVEEHLMLDREFFSLSQWQIVLPRREFEQSLSENIEGPTKADLKVQPGPNERRNVGGAPTKYDWAGAAAAAAVFLIGNVSSAKELTTHITEWFSAQDKYPDAKDIRQFVADIEKNRRRAAGET